MAVEPGFPRASDLDRSATLSEGARCGPLPPSSCENCGSPSHRVSSAPSAARCGGLRAREQRRAKVEDAEAASSRSSLPHLGPPGQCMSRTSFDLLTSSSASKPAPPTSSLGLANPSHLAAMALTERTWPCSRGEPPPDSASSRDRAACTRRQDSSLSSWTSAQKSKPRSTPARQSRSMASSDRARSAKGSRPASPSSPHRDSATARSHPPRSARLRPSRAPSGSDPPSVP